MAVLKCDSNRPALGVIADPGRGEITIHAYPLSLVLKPDETNRLLDELGAALAKLAVKDSPVLAEVSEA